ncbi:hypothetical protein [Rodentibacter pneumotropicus]|uniref:Uncharacterized protein n=1 Tax=Rodentibacter pneumotropicus TaxID=758 RepID=A0A4S2PPA8_9PAST|nr:hypothetical protein [Rodentibacter pneumotropicus]THA05523.1 hypothetical protein D3M77_09375 [Rodentibacter pneumotropicus]THA16341.1 hypothetical protein D3M76_03485 [Rodentibacter pneumotropicus]
MAQTQVHNQIHNMARMVTLNHPNAFDAVCFQKIYLTPNGQNQIGGFDVLGGEDVPEIDFKHLGMAKVLFVDPWQASKIISDNINANDVRVKIMAMIEPDIEGEFTLNKGDIFYIQIDSSLGLAYEIVGIELPVGLPSAMNAKRYLINKRDDLDYIESLPKE